MTIPDQIIRDAVRDAIRDEVNDARLLSIPQAAQLLNVSDETARRLIGSGVDVGGKGYKVRLADVRRLIAERTIKL
jgi:excisionase family DNA binding protein